MATTEEQKGMELQERESRGQQELLFDAEDANSKEHKLSLRQAIKLYPKAVGWSVLMSAAVIMDGYDLKLIGSLFGAPTFQKAYGREVKPGHYEIPAPWQAGLTNGSNVGQILGLLLSGYAVERFGHRKTMAGALLVLPCLIFIQFFAKGLGQLQAGQVLIGIVGHILRPETH